MDDEEYSLLGDDEYVVDFDPTTSECGDGGDVSEALKWLKAEQEVEEVSAVTVDQVEKTSLARHAELAQRVVSASFRRLYVRGRAHMDPVYGPKEKVRQRLFMVAPYIQVPSLDDPGIFDKLSSGRVVSRVGAPTGLGKTTKFPGMVAKRCDLRVCLVTVDATIAKLAMERQRDAYAIPVSSRCWRRKKQAFLAGISYDDFCGIMRSSGRTRFFLDFDVFIFDEPQVRRAEVWAAKQLFGCYAPASCSLLLMSATASTDAANNAMGARTGKFLEEPVSGGFGPLLRSGQLVTKFCVDRTQVVVPDYLRAASVVAYYEEAGCDVKTADIASCYDDYGDIFRWLKNGEAVVPRVLVTTPEIALAYSFPVSYVVTSGTETVFEVDRGALVEREALLREEDVLQHRGRTARGLAPGSGGIIATKSRDDGSAELSGAEACKAYLLLIAADVEPRAAKIFSDAVAMLPKGMDRDTAVMLLSIGLPPVLTMRYLGRDGRIAARFVEAMRLFLEPDFFLYPSCDTDPVGYESWITERMGAYHSDGDLIDVEAVVPFASPRLLRVHMHTLFAMSRKWLKVVRWVAPADGYVSDGENEIIVRPVENLAIEVPRFVRSEKREVEEEEIASPVAQWRLEVKPDDVEKRRRRKAMSWADDPRCVEAVSQLRRGAEEGRAYGPVSADVTRVDVGGTAGIELSSPRSPVEVGSPSGAMITKLPASMYDMMADGKALTPGFFYDLMSTYKRVGDRLVRSQLFDNWGNPWLSVLGSYADQTCLLYVKDRGGASLLTRFLGELYDRFRTEIFSVCATSNLYRSNFERFFGSGEPSTSKLERQIRRGVLPIAQSDLFMRRFVTVKRECDAAMMSLERVDIFVPHIVTRMQGPLPVGRRRNKRGFLPTVGEDCVSQPSGGFLGAFLK